MTRKNWEKFRNFMFWSAGCTLLRDEGFSLSMEVLYGGLVNSNFNLKNIKHLAVHFFQFLVIKTLDLDPHWPKMLDPDPHWNKFGSNTLWYRIRITYEIVSFKLHINNFPHVLVWRKRWKCPPARRRRRAQPPRQPHLRSTTPPPLQTSSAWLWIPNINSSP